MGKWVSTNDLRLMNDAGTRATRRCVCYRGGYGGYLARMKSKGLPLVRRIYFDLAAMLGASNAVGMMLYTPYEDES